MTPRTHKAAPAQLLTEPPLTVLESYNQRLLRGLLDCAPEAMLILDADGGITLANRRAERLFGFGRGRLVRAHLPALLEPWPLHVDKIGCTRAVCAHSADGTVFDAELTLQPVAAAAGTILTCVVRDLTEARRTDQRQQVLERASASLAASLDYEVTLRHVARAAVPALATWCVVDLVDPDGTPRLVAVAHAEDGKEQLVRSLREQYPFDPAARYGLPAVLRNGRAVLYRAVPDAWRVAAARSPDHLALMRVLSAQSSMCAPLIAHGRTLGAITLVSAVPERHFDVADLALAEELGRRAGQAIDNARLYQAAQAARDLGQQRGLALQGAIAQLEAIQEVTDAALVHLPMDRLLRELLVRLRDILHVDTVAVLLIDAQRQMYVVKAAIGLEAEVEAGIQVPLQRGVAGRIASTTEPTIIDDLRTVDVHSPILRSSGIRALLGSPLLLEGRVIGVLHVGTRGQRQFTNEDARLLRLVADRVTLAISQSQLYESERAARLQAELLAAEWEATLRQIADGVIVADQAGQITFMNAGAPPVIGV